jgi:hypothetical protein
MRMTLKYADSLAYFFTLSQPLLSSQTASGQLALRSGSTTRALGCPASSWGPVTAQLVTVLAANACCARRSGGRRLYSRWGEGGAAHGSHAAENYPCSYDHVTSSLVMGCEGPALQWMQRLGLPCSHRTSFFPKQGLAMPTSHVFFHSWCAPVLLSPRVAL